MDVNESNKSVVEEQKQDVLLALDKKEKTVAAVTGIDKQGNLKTAPPQKKHNNEFLKLDRHGDIASNFLKNFISQLKDPTRFELFKTEISKVEESAKEIQKHEEKPTKALKAKLDDMRVNSEQRSPQEQSVSDNVKNIYSNGDNYFVNPNKIDWQTLKSFGINKEQIENSKYFESMLRGYKSPHTFPIESKIGNITLKTDARISFRPNENGDVVLAIHGIRKKLELDRPYFGHEFSKEDKENLLKTGNMGRKVDIKNYFTGETIPSFISIDRLTNELVSMRADKFPFPDGINGVNLNERQKNDLRDGKAVWVEDMISSKTQKPYSAFVQINADKRTLEFIFPKNNQKQSNEMGVRIPKLLAGVELTEKQQADLRSDKTIYVRGMKDKQGEEYNAYIKVNHEDNKLDFFKFNPDKAKDKAKEITPSDEHKTQVAVNSEGKTSEATKKIEEPLKQGQSKPTESQSSKLNKKEIQEKEITQAPNKGKRIKV